LSKHFGGLTAVENLSLSIAHGSLVSLLGPSGCGKTTTLRLIAGFLQPDSGTIKVGERVVSGPGIHLPPEKRNMSMIFQSYALWPHMTISQNVAYGLKLRRLASCEISTRVNRMLDTMRLKPLADRYPGEISGGQQQRAALARALVVEPEILLLDEPLSNLDANLREEMRFEIRQLHDAYRTTTIYVTHDQIEAMTTADVIVVMNEGRVEQAGSPEEIYRRPRSEFVARFIGGTNILRGRKTAPMTADCGGLVLECGEGAFNAAAATAASAIVSIRPHQIALEAANGSGGMHSGSNQAFHKGANQAEGQVSRQVFLGAQRDYLVRLAGGQELRVLAPLEVNFPEGSQVRLTLPSLHCRALPE
jgi:iron(III) transport system ATP-binding protein